MNEYWNIQRKLLEGKTKEDDELNDESEVEIVEKRKKNKTIKTTSESDDYSDECITNENDPYVEDYYNEINDILGHDNMGMYENVQNNENDIHHESNDNVDDIIDSIYTNRRDYDFTSPCRTRTQGNRKSTRDGKDTNEKFYEGMGDSVMNSIDLCESSPQSREKKVCVVSPSRSRAHINRARELGEIRA